MKNFKNGLFLAFGIAIACCFNWTPAKAAGPENNSFAPATFSEVIIGAKYTKDTVAVYLVKKPVPSALNGPVRVIFPQKTAGGVTTNNSVDGWYDAQSQEIRIKKTQLEGVGFTMTTALAIRPVAIEAIAQKKKKVE